VEQPDRRIDPKDKRHLISYLHKASEGVRLKDFIGASDTLDLILKEDPSLIDAHFLSGVVAMKQQRFDEALRSFQRVLQLNSNYAMAHFNLGLVYRAMGRLDQAVPAFKRALDLDPSHMKALVSLAMAYHESGAQSEAEACYARALRFYEQRLTTSRTPETLASFHDTLGIIHASRGALEKAAQHFNSALQYKPDMPGAHYNLGLICEQQGRVADAIAAYKNEIRSNPDNFKAHQNLGLIYRKDRDFDAAIEQFKKVVHCLPDHAPAYFLLGECYFLSSKSLTEAAKYIEESLALNPRFGRGYLLLAAIYEKQGKHAAAREALRKARALGVSSVPR
jgi:tetratricopeptide (TPR) repeat protein